MELDKIPYYTFGQGSVAGIENVMISHTGYTGAGGYELYVADDRAPALWEALMEAVSLGASPMDFSPLDSVLVIRLGLKWAIFCTVKTSMTRLLL